jgi:hypothetical protein
VKTSRTNRPPMRPTTCQTCGSAMLTRYPARKPHLCRQCREAHNCYLPTEQEIAAAAAEIRRKNLEEMLGRPSPRTPEPSIRELAMWVMGGEVGEEAEADVDGLPDRGSAGGRSGD